MAEERRAGGQNIWLMASLGLNLALVVVVVLGVLFYNVRKGLWGHSIPSIELIAMARDVEAGEKLKAEDLEVRAVPKQYQDSFGTVVEAEDLNFAVGQTVNRNIEKGRWLQWDYITGDVPPPPPPIKDGWVAFAIELDSKRSPGDILRPNARVNILGMISGKAVRIIKGVTVLAVGGSRNSPGLMQEPNTTPGTPKSYNSITVELPEDVALQLTNVLTHANGSCWFELLPANVAPMPDFNIINPELRKLAEAPAMPVRGDLPAGGASGGTEGVTMPGSQTWE
jgi:Flp pilus assembly protein CpaB